MLLEPGISTMRSGGRCRLPPSLGRMQAEHTILWVEKSVPCYELFLKADVDPLLPEYQGLNVTGWGCHVEPNARTSEGSPSDAQGAPPALEEKPVTTPLALASHEGRLPIIS